MPLALCSAPSCRCTAAAAPSGRARELNNVRHRLRKFYRRKKELSDDQLNRSRLLEFFDRDGTASAPTTWWWCARLLRAAEGGHEEDAGEVDQENTGQISFDGHLQIVLNKRVERPGHDDILKAFRLFDREGSGAVSFAQLKRIAQQIGETISDEELHEMIAEADRKGSGVVDEEDFVKIITSHAKHYDGEK